MLELVDVGWGVGVFLEDVVSEGLLSDEGSWVGSVGLSDVFELIVVDMVVTTTTVLTSWSVSTVEGSELPPVGLAGGSDSAGVVAASLEPPRCLRTIRRPPL